MTATEKAWLAGFVDGEGCFTVLILNRKHGPPSFAITCQITNTNLPVLQYIQSHFGGTIHPRKAKRGQNKKTVYLLHMSRFKGCEAIIDATLPYLKIKREVALLVRNFPRRNGKSLGHGKGSTKADPEIIKNQLAIYNQVRQLNKRGIKPLILSGEPNY